ncbi:hypothetical protein FQZ97_703030 [compost metagenome]
MAGHSARTRLGRAKLATRARGRRLEHRAAQCVRRRVRPGRRAGNRAFRAAHGGARHHGLRLCLAEKPLPAAHSERAGLVVPGLFRAGRRFRPGFAGHQGTPRRRYLRGERPENLDHLRPVRRHDVLPGPHQPRRQGAGGHFLPAHRHAQSRRVAAADPDAGRRRGDQRGLSGRREGARVAPGRRSGPGLDLCQVPAVARTLRRGAGRARQARAGPPATAGGPAQGRWPAAGRRSGVRAPAGAAGDRYAGAGADQSAADRARPAWRRTWRGSFNPEIPGIHAGAAH